MGQDEVKQVALDLWREINLRNLEENILPTRRRAQLILRKGDSHRVEKVLLRKL
jgi:type I pantothenate kinase